MVGLFGIWLYFSRRDPNSSNIFNVGDDKRTTNDFFANVVILMVLPFRTKPLYRSIIDCTSEPPFLELDGGIGQLVLRYL